MTQGRKSKWRARAFLPLLALLLLAAIVSAAPAAAAPATEEYDLALPEADGDSSESDDEAVAPASSSAPPTGPVAPSGAGDGEGKADGSAEDLFAAPATDRPIRNLAANDSGDGGFPALLILLGLIAATCAGVAIFRFRRTIAAGTPGGEMSSGTQSP